MTHTPGPWKAITGGADAKVVCPDGRSFLIGDIIYHDENKSNARLIAAAPELLEALKLVTHARPTRYVRGDGTDTPFLISNNVLDIVQQAIAKAESK